MGRRRLDGVGYKECKLEKGGKRNGGSRVGRRMREWDEENWREQGGKENEGMG